MASRYKRIKKRTKRTTRRRRRNTRKGGAWRSEVHLPYKENVYTTPVYTRNADLLANSQYRDMRMSNPNYGSPYTKWTDGTFDERMNKINKLKEELSVQYNAKSDARAADMTRIRTDAPKLSINQLYNRTFGSKEMRDQHTNEKLHELESRRQRDEDDYNRAIKKMSIAEKEIYDAKNEFTQNKIKL